MKFVNFYKDLMLQVIQLIDLNFLHWHNSNVEFSMLTYWYSWCDITTDQQFLIKYFNGIKIDSWMWREPLWCSIIGWEIGSLCNTNFCNAIWYVIMIMNCNYDVTMISNWLLILFVFFRIICIVSFCWQISRSTYSKTTANSWFTKRSYCLKWSSCS
jgi:hypothetical protein